MKQVFFALSFLLAKTAFAISVYNCAITAEGKASPSAPWTKHLLLSPDFYNEVHFDRTTLSLSIHSANTQIIGDVNGQPGFKLQGDVRAATFESAYDKGTIRCEEKVELLSVLQFKPWKQFFSNDRRVSEGNILNRIDLGDIQYGYACFLGDANHATAVIKADTGVVGHVLSSYEIQYQWTANVCVRSSGSSPNDYVCEESAPRAFTKSVYNCYENGPAYP